MEGIIYKLTSPSGKVYIGQTISGIKERFKEHNKSRNKFPINNALQKYGPDKFKINIIATINSNNKETVINQLNKMEIFFINLHDSFNSGYNLTTGGKNYCRSESTKEKFRKIMLGQQRSLGFKCTEENKINLSNKFSFPIIQYTKNGDYIKEWRGATTASKELHIQRQDIGSCCRNKLRSAGGYIWKYKKDVI